MSRQRQGASLRDTEEDKIDGGRGGIVLFYGRTNLKSGTITGGRTEQIIEIVAYATIFFMLRIISGQES